MSEPENRTDLRDLKIALQIMSHDGMKMLIPALSAVIGLATCAGLMYWSFGELQNFSPDSIALSRIELPTQAATPVIAPAKPVVASRPVVRTVKVKPKKTVAKPHRRVASRAYQDYYFWGQDHPTNGRVIRANEACTEYSWDTKKLSSRDRNGFRLAN